MQTSSQSHTYSSFIRPVESQGKNTKNWVFREWKELFRWNKNNFAWFLKCYVLIKYKT